MIKRLLAILGRRTMLTFGLVTFMVGALLATVNITSRYALKVYVDDQLKRIPWDLAVYQSGAVNGDRSLHDYVARTPGVTKVESMAFLRARFPAEGEVEAQIDNKPFSTPWLCLLAASDPAILPPELGFALSKNGAQGTKGRGAGARRSRVRDGQGVPRAAGGEELHAAGPRRGAAALPLQHAAAVGGAPGSRRPEPVADGPDRLGQLHPLHRRDPADALRLGHPHEVRPGRDRLRAGGRARRRQRGRRPHPDGRVHARGRLRREDRPAVAHLGLGHPGLARARRERQHAAAPRRDRECAAAEEDLHRPAGALARRRGSRR